MTDNLEEWTRLVRASRGEIDPGRQCTTDALDDLYGQPAHPEPVEGPWTWSAILTLLAALAAGGAAVWWFAA